jgi:hypothetical protein
MAEEVARFLKRNDQDVIALGQFRAPPQANASAGPVVAKLLREELAQRGVAVKRQAPWGVEGDYGLVDQVDTGGLAARIKGRIVDHHGAEVYSGTWYLGAEPAIMTLFGPTAELPLDKGEVARARALGVSIETPKVTIDTTRVVAGPGSPYALEVYVAQEGQWRLLTPEDEDGLAFVPIRRGEMYAVALINDSPEDAAVTLTIDGLNLFAFSQNKDYSFVIVPKKSRGFIRGWYRTNETSDAFLITEYGRGAVAELGLAPSEIGTITARFAAAWPLDSPPPAEERSLLASRGMGNATGRGPEVQAHFKEVQRRVGVTRATVSVRYTR